MSFARVINALSLPSDARVDQRVPKKLLVENGAPPAVDKRQIQDGIEEMVWVAALKPNNIGVLAFRDEVREYLEIAILTATLRSAAKSTRLTELIHRAIPYPVVLVGAQSGAVSISLAHKRWSQGEAGKTVLDSGVIEARLDDELDADVLQGFLAALSLTRQARSTLYTLYQGWTDTVLSLQAAHVTGAFASPTSAEHAAARREALQTCAQLESQITGLRAAAAKEKQLPRQVEINLELKRLQADYAAARARL